MTRVLGICENLLDLSDRRTFAVAPGRYAVYACCLTVFLGLGVHLRLNGLTLLQLDSGIKRAEDCGCYGSLSPVASAALISYHGVEVMSASRSGTPLERK